LWDGIVLQKLGEHIQACFERADAAERLAAQTQDATLKAEHEAIAQRWRHLARSYQFVESLERFLLDIEANKNARPPERPKSE
jgi:hypothetical protein